MIKSVVGFVFGGGVGLLLRPLLDSWLRWREIEQARPEAETERAERFAADLAAWTDTSDATLTHRDTEAS